MRPVLVTSVFLAALMFNVADSSGGCFLRRCCCRPRCHSRFRHCAPVPYQYHPVPERAPAEEAAPSPAGSDWPPGAPAARATQ
jgi:hypothetical protein